VLHGQLAAGAAELLVAVDRAAGAPGGIEHDQARRGEVGCHIRLPRLRPPLNSSIVRQTKLRMLVHLEAPSLGRAREFLDAVRRSRLLHRGFVSPPRSREPYREYLARLRGASHEGYFVCLSDGELVGVVNVNEIVRGVFRSAYLGFYAFAPHQGRGYMSAGVALAIARAFSKSRLHRLEANIQPANLRSVALVKRLGFRLEGLSRRYLKISGRWRDHERWAITIEDWRGKLSNREDPLQVSGDIVNTRPSGAKPR
jgi:ribosomal-protein-alanine N-acetyltransferase